MPAHISPGSHACFLYDTEAAHQQALVVYLLDGLIRGDQVVYFADEHTPAVVIDYLHRHNAERYFATGQLEVFEAKQIYLSSGRFQWEAMVRLLKERMQQVLASGYGGLWVTGEASWALRGYPGSEQLAEYESQVHTIFAEPACRLTAMCQYKRTQFSAKALLNILMTHPVVASATEVGANPWFMPPDQYLNADLRGRMVRDKMAEPVNRSRLQDALHLPEAKVLKLLEDFLLAS